MFLFLLAHCFCAVYSDVQVQAAYDVINRQVPECGIAEGKVQLERIDPNANGCPVFEYYSNKGILYVRGSSGVAICHGFYTFMKTYHFGIITWAGRNINWPKDIPDTDLYRQESPVKFHYNYNVVTYGYTLSFYDWERWRKEIDWMALHGFDFPLMYNGFEAIGTRVWRRFNLTQEEIDEFYVGPAYLPWQRMGNIINHDGHITDEYHKVMVALQKKLLDALSVLGMTPICPAFAGFIPRGILRLYPDVKFYRLAWCGFPEKSQATLLSPEEDLFTKIGGMYVEEYEKEFGPQKFYIADTFNEMSIPAEGDRYEWLASMGERLYKSIAQINPDATWVIQGWAFANERYEWDQATTKAFLSRVPNDKMLILDLATDYNKYHFYNEFGWDYYDGFYGKQWIYSVIPNMGGKSVFTGVLEYYVNGHLTALNSPNRGNMVGIGMAPEGFENDELLFELYTDTMWRSFETNLDDWLRNYAINRYGAYPDDIHSSWTLLRNSAYNQLVDQIHYNWQFPPGTRNGNACISDDFYECCKLWTFASVKTPELEKSDLYKADAIEASCHLAGITLEKLAAGMVDAFNDGDKDRARYCWTHFASLLLDMDYVLSAHPHFRLEEWLDSAEKIAEGNETLIAHYRESGRYLITVWGPSTYPLYDYAARMWNGLCRDYYYHRWRIWYEDKMADKDPSADVKAFEESWVADSTLSRSPKPKDVVKACRQLVDHAEGIDLTNWEWPKN
ncbi:Alpha-N-acetylglucosaminidase [Tritrichomonas foetus]|uniref:Alpha-N-acetylglucosaminidase n=1 Tax=Tritrichomonas foetus TaxID=1144522 RepID=A0A1J4K3Z6_9EUKA|nr:Alpha-N-acetylglucosaminidase [Tritrichomonas foetus]|eukprot:OHT06111.1 Alpha-N-acetylglucosaminidase [Tritrichomonas foetus]